MFPPKDDQAVALIDKTADLVSRNGFRLLEMMQERESSNPNLAFIFPSHPHHPYFMWRVNNPGKSLPALQLRLSPHDPVTPAAPFSRPPPPPPQFHQQPSHLTISPQFQQSAALLAQNPVATALAALAQPESAQNLMLLLALQTAASAPQPQITSPTPPVPPPAPTLVSATGDLVRALGDEEPMRRFITLVSNAMKDCSQSNIQAGKLWLLDNCKTPAQVDAATHFLVRVCESRDTFEERLHVLYLLNDVIYHSERKNLQWVKDAIFPHLSSLLQIVYRTAGNNKVSKAKVMKILQIWNDKNLIDPREVDRFRNELLNPNTLAPPPQPNPPLIHIQQTQVNLARPPPVRPPPSPAPVQPQSLPMRVQSPLARPPPPPPTQQSPPRPIAAFHAQPPASLPPQIPQQLPSTSTQLSSIPAQGLPAIAAPTTPITRPVLEHPPMQVADKKYWELPAGLMVTAQSLDAPPYTPIKSALIKASDGYPPKRTPTLLAAVDDFYAGLDVLRSQLKDQKQKDGFVEQEDHDAAEAKEDAAVVPEQEKVKYDRDGWQIGYLDEWIRDIESRRAKAVVETRKGYEIPPPSFGRPKEDDREEPDRGNSGLARSSKSVALRSRSRSRSRSSSRARKRIAISSRSSSRSSSSSSLRGKRKRLSTDSRRRKRSRSASSSSSEGSSDDEGRKHRRKGRQSRSRSREEKRGNRKRRGRSVSLSSSTSSSSSSNTVNSRRSSSGSSRSSSGSSRSRDERKRRNNRRGSTSGEDEPMRGRKTMSEPRRRSFKDEDEDDRAGSDKYRAQSRSSGVSWKKDTQMEIDPPPTLGVGLGAASVMMPLPAPPVAPVSNDALFDDFRRAKSYSYTRDLMAAAATGSRKESACFRCGRAGHIARDCDDFPPARS
ncbi:hypothetical protein BJ742DRAFT_33045 [Cladochytrium replicatum]|nr:hypothetical protein BJ742DRAFT_33045 [Cladochytrium replicatum]